MKSTTLKIFGFVLFSIFLNSCTTLLYTNLDVLRPAKVTFSPEIKRVLIVNNSVIQPYDYGHKTQLLNNKVKNITISTDSLSIFCLGSFSEELIQREFFTSVDLLPNSMNKSTDFFYVKYLNSDTIKALCARYKADAIISLDRIKVIDKISEYYAQDEKLYIADLDVNFETQWSIHNPNEVKFTATTFKDTIFWESESYQRRKVLNDLPDRNNALIDGALYVGQNTVKRMIPYWEKVDRYFFSTKNKYMKQAIDSVYFKNWTSAIKSWETVLNKSFDKATKAKAANNIAIAYEIIGNIEKAIEYANLSIEYFEQSLTSDFDSYLRTANYLVELKQREKEIKLIKKQLAE